MPRPVLELVKCTQGFMFEVFSCKALATYTADSTSPSFALSHLVYTTMNFRLALSSILINMPSVFLKPCLMSISSMIRCLFSSPQLDRQYSISRPHCRISLFEASLAYPQPGASTNMVLCGLRILRKASYLVLPGFLLVSTKSFWTKELISELFPTLLLPKKTYSLTGFLCGIVCLMLSRLHTAWTPVTKNCWIAQAPISLLLTKGKYFSAVRSVIKACFEAQTTPDCRTFFMKRQAEIQILCNIKESCLYLVDTRSLIALDFRHLNSQAAPLCPQQRSLCLECIEHSYKTAIIGHMRVLFGISLSILRLDSRTLCVQYDQRLHT